MSENEPIGRESFDPICEQCNCLMYPFAYEDIEGFTCPMCGWSIDIEEIAKP